MALGCFKGILKGCHMASEAALNSCLLQPVLILCHVMERLLGYLYAAGTAVCTSPHVITFFCCFFVFFLDFSIIVLHLLVSHLLWSLPPY